MDIELGHYAGAQSRMYWTVRVAKNEVVVASGKAVPYPTWIGTIDESGKITLWTPAGFVPRGYKDAAMALLETAKAQLVAAGKVHA